MAKEKQNSAAATVVDEKNLPEVLQDQPTNVDMYKNIIDDINKESDERKRNMLKSRYQKALYRNGQALLERRRSKRIADEVTLYKVRQMTRLLRFLMGTTVEEKTLEYAKTPDEIWKKEALSKDGKSIETTLLDGKKKSFKEGDFMPSIIDVVDFDKMVSELESKLNERRREIDKDYETELQKWDAKFGEYWDRSWRW